MVISERTKEIIEYLLESNNYVTVLEVAIDEFYRKGSYEC